MASRLCSRPEFPRQVADLLVRATGAGPEREAAIREAFLARPILDPAEALGVSRAVLVLCGVASNRREPLTGEPRSDLSRLMEGAYGLQDLRSPSAFAVPGLLEAYCYMGAGFARGVDWVFRAVTGASILEHLRRALSLLEPSAKTA